MAFSFTEEQEQFRDVLARFLRDKSPTTEIRKLMETDSGYDAEVWQQVCNDMGLAGIHLPEESGGAGYGPVELGIVMEEQGRALLCGPYLSSAVLAGLAISDVTSGEKQAARLAGIVDGSVVATLAVTEAQGLWHMADITTQAVPVDGGYQLTGRKTFVSNGQDADIIYVVAETGAGLSLFAVDAGADGLEIEGLEGVDATRRIAHLSFKNCVAELVGTEGSFDLEAVFDQVLIAFAHEQLGGAQAMLESALDYAKLRVQFGRVIGSFQALKHRFADLHVELELAKAAVYQAAQALADGEDVRAYASMAKATASDMFLFAAKECIQFHGGIGFTWENDTHLWFKRAKSAEVFLGSPADHRERMLQAMGV